MSVTLQLVHFVAGLIVLAEALNKVTRIDLFDGHLGWLPRLRGFGWLLLPWRWKRERVVDVLKAAGWALLAIGAGAAFVTPLLHHALHPTLADAAVIAGVALFVIRARVKEGWGAP